MALLVGELRAALDLDTDKFDRGLDRSQGRFGKFVKGAAVASAAAAVAAGAGLLALAKGAAEDEKAQAVLAKTLKNTAKATDAQVASIEEYITKTGVATGVTDDQMRPALANLVRATGDVSKAQGLMGLAMDVSAGTGKDLGAVTMALAKAQNGSVGGLAKLGIATKDASGKTLTFDQIQKNLAKTFTGQSAAAAETTAGKFARLQLIIAEAGETIGAKVLPVLLALGTFLLNKVVPAVFEFGTRVQFKLLPVLRRFADFFSTQIMPQLKGFAGFVRDTVLPAVAGIISAFSGLGKKMVTAIGPVDVLGIVGDIARGAKAWAAGLINGFKTGLEDGDWGPLGATIGNGVVKAVQSAGSAVDRIGAALGALLDMVDWGALGGKISGAITGMLRSVDWKHVGEVLGDAIVTVVQRTSTLGQKLGTAFKDLISRIDWEAVGRDSTDAIGGFISGVDWGKVAKALGIALLKSLKINVQIKQAVENSAADLVTGIFKSISIEIENGRLWLVGKTRQVGAALIDGLKNGVVGGLKGIGGWLKRTFVDPVIAWVKLGFGIHSPSTVFASIGRDLINGLKNGMIERWRNVTGWISGLRASVLTWLGDPSKWLAQKGRNVIWGFLNGMKGVWTDVTKWVGGIATWIKDHKGPVALDGTLLIPAGRAIMDGFLKGLKSGAGPAWKFVSSVGGKSVDALRSAIGGPFMGGGDPAPTNLSAMQALVRTVAAQRGWGTGSQWDALYQLVQHESGFNPNAQNPTSTAYGLFQFLNSTWGSVGASKTSDPWGQTAAGLRYIANAYGSPAAAWSAWQSRSPHWYAKGTPWVPNDQLAYVHKGEAIVPAYANRGAAVSGQGGLRLDPGTIDALARANKKAFADAMREGTFTLVNRGAGSSYVLQMTNG